MQFGMQPQVPSVWQVRGLSQVLVAQHCCPLPPHAPQAELPQATPSAHAAHTVPPTPHELTDDPGSHVETLQHPLHEVASHTHTPVSQRWPSAHDPCWHAPPHPSSAPHALPSQVGVHWQIPSWQRSGLAHPDSAQHGWPFPPHTPQSTPQVWPLVHGAQTTPPLPQDEFSAPSSQDVPLQHPAQEVTSHLQTPATQRSPWAQVPRVQTPSQPLLAPHAAPAQLDTQAPAPQTLGCPPPPQSRPIEHPPQSTSWPQGSRS
jgi:hypothetical protein